MSNLESDTHFTIIDAVCSPEETYKFNSDKQVRVGHLTQLSFTTSNKKLNPDTHVKDPMDPDTNVPIIGPFDFIKWDGGQTDNIEFTVRVSSANIGLIRQAASATAGGADLSMEFKIYDYDHSAKKYYPRLGTDKGSPVTGKLAQGSKIRMDEDPISGDPATYRVTLIMSPKNETGSQVLNVATSETQKFVREFGIHVAQ